MTGDSCVSRMPGRREHSDIEVPRLTEGIDDGSHRRWKVPQHRRGGMGEELVRRHCEGVDDRPGRDANPRTRGATQLLAGRLAPESRHERRVVADDADPTEGRSEIASSKSPRRDPRGSSVHHREDVAEMCRQVCARHPRTLPPDASRSGAADPIRGLFSFSAACGGQPAHRRRAPRSVTAHDMAAHRPNLPAEREKGQSSAGTSGSRRLRGGRRWVPTRRRSRRR